MKAWYKNPLIIAVIVASIGWFAWITKVGIMSEGKATEVSVQVADTQIRADIQSLNGKLDNLCTSMGDLKGGLRDHETRQSAQIEKIYDMLIAIARDTKSTDKEKMGNRSKVLEKVPESKRSTR